MNTHAYKTVYMHRCIECDRKLVLIDPSDRSCALFGLLRIDSSDSEE